VSALLEVQGLNKAFGAVIAANDIGVSVAEGERIGIIGANGAGKTTFVNTVTGYLKPDSGRVAFLGRDITQLPPRAIIAAGISRSFQVPQVFTSASVADNLLIALGLAESGALPLWRALRRPARSAAVEALLARFGIAQYRDQPARLLPQGVRKLLDIAMATVRAPRLLLLDEPTSGISAEEKFAIMDVVMGATEAERRAILFVEHDLDIIRRYATRVLAFADGAIIAEGTPAAVIADANVKRLILGESAAPRRAAGAAP
jgi:branched-chain amino acid transport system ATP-binding protein